MTQTKKTQIKVSRTEFTNKVTEGLNRAELAEYFGISKGAVTGFAKQLDLKIKVTRTGVSKFLLVDDEDSTQEESNVPSVDALNEALATNNY